MNVQVGCNLSHSSHQLLKETPVILVVVCGRQADARQQSIPQRVGTFDIWIRSKHASTATTAASDSIIWFLLILYMNQSMNQSESYVFPWFSCIFLVLPFLSNLSKLASLRHAPTSHLAFAEAGGDRGSRKATTHETTQRGMTHMTQHLCIILCIYAYIYINMYTYFIFLYLYVY